MALPTKTHSARLPLTCTAHPSLCCVSFSSDCSFILHFPSLFCPLFLFSHFYFSLPTPLSCRLLLWLTASINVTHCRTLCHSHKRCFAIAERGNRMLQHCLWTLCTAWFLLGQSILERGGSLAPSLMGGQMVLPGM